MISKEQETYHEDYEEEDIEVIQIKLDVLRQKEKNGRYIVVKNEPPKYNKGCDLDENYLSLFSKSTSNNSQDSYTLKSRCDACQFLFTAVDYFGEDREIVKVAMNYLDRFTVNNTLITEKDELSSKDKPFIPNLGLLVLLSMDLAIKLFSSTSGCPIRARLNVLLMSKSNPHLLTTNSVHYNANKFGSLKDMGGITFTEEEILNSQSRLLHSLDFYLHPPTSSAYIHSILQIFLVRINPKTEAKHDENTCNRYSPYSNSCRSFIRELYKLATFQTELSLFSGNRAFVQPSILAFAALDNTAEPTGILHDSQLFSDSWKALWFSFISDFPCTEQLGIVRTSEAYQDVKHELMTSWKQSCFHLSEGNVDFSDDGDIKNSKPPLQEPTSTDVVLIDGEHHDINVDKISNTSVCSSRGNVATKKIRKKNNKRKTSLPDRLSYDTSRGRNVVTPSDFPGSKTKKIS